MSFKPAGYTSVAPYLIVADAQRTLDFLREIFGCTPLHTHRREDGTIMHTELRIDDTVIMLGQMPESGPSHVHIYVPDVNSTFVRALDAGGDVLQKPEDKPDGDRRCGVVDPNGITWWFATKIDQPA